jgi:hypothetical protein
MGTPSVTNIIKSGAALWYAPVGETKPDETSVAYAAAWGGNWAKVGYTKAPLTLAYESEEFDIEVDEELGPVKRRRVKETMTLETVLAELTAAYLALVNANQTAVSSVAAGAGQKAYEYTGLGGVAILTEKEWGFEGLYLDSSGNNLPIRVFVHIGTAKLNDSLKFSQKDTDYTGISLQIKALADTSQSAGNKFLLFQRVTAPASS